MEIIEKEQQKEPIQEPTRQQLRTQKKQQIIVEQNVNRYIQAYNIAVKKVYGLGLESAKRKVSAAKIKENRIHELSELNTAYMDGWKVLLTRVNFNFPLANLNPNHFSNCLIWE